LFSEKSAFSILNLRGVVTVTCDSKAARKRQSWAWGQWSRGRSQTTSAENPSPLTWKGITVKVTRLLHRATQRSHGEPQSVFLCGSLRLLCASLCNSATFASVRFFFLQSLDTLDLQEPLQKPRDLALPKYRPIHADEFLPQVAPSTLADTTVHPGLQRGQHLLRRKAQFLQC